MDCIESSDLEEGEILENDNESLSSFSESWSDEFGSLKNQYDLVSECRNKKSGNKENKANGLLSSKTNGYGISMNRPKLSGRSDNKSGMNIIDLGLEEVSSDGDCLSDNDGKHLCDNFDFKIHKEKRSQFSGTVEDIMSEIGETISRKKSHSSHRKKRARHSFDRYKDNCNPWRHKNSHAKVKKPKRRLGPCDSSLDEVFTEERKKRKRAASYVIEESIKKPKIRDFDEVRQTLLEKLRKQKAEEAKATVENLTPDVEEVESTEIQEVEMGIENTNYVDNPTADNQNVNTMSNATNKDIDEEDDNDDLDLIELRLAALESNCTSKASSKYEVKVNNKEETEGQNERSEDMDLDRYELLLRAEALKTALLKKHQKRLNKAKEMSNEANSNSSNNQFIDSFLPVREESSSDEKPSTSNVTEISSQKEMKNLIEEKPGKNSSDEVRVTTLTSTMSSSNLKKAKTKRKKRKSDSLQNHAKENTENTDALEEDDKTLRSQLLSDLLRKKSLKDSERKAVLTDSVQTSANQLPTVQSEKLEPKGAILTTVPKKNSLQKINTNHVNTTKPATVPRIPKPEIQRIIVHLGSEDSSDDNDADENSTLKGEDFREENTATKEINETLRANYEKSVDLLLSQTWQKIEGEIAAARNAQGTPEAVYKHLPLSQRLEYIRLKQKIAERERLKKVKENSGKPSSGPSNEESALRKETAENKNSTSINTQTTKVSKVDSCKQNVNLQRTGVSDKKVPVNSKIVKNLNEANAKQKPVVISKFNSVKNGRKYVAPPNGVSAKQISQKNSLLQSSQTLISKLKLLLKKIKIEKTIEENYEKEISKLKNQINLFEKRKLEQKFKIKKLAEESSRTYKVIQQITNLGKKTKENLGNKKCGSNGESKNEGIGIAVEVSKNEAKDSEETKSEEITKVPEETKCEGIMKGAEEFKEDTKADDKTGKELCESGNFSSANAVLMDYNSPLQVFNKTSSDTDRVDPNVMVCQFDLMGICKDKECTYQHFRNSQSLQCISVAGKPTEEE